MSAEVINIPKFFDSVRDKRTPFVFRVEPDKEIIDFMELLISERGYHLEPCEHATVLTFPSTPKKFNSLNQEETPKSSRPLFIVNSESS